MSRLRVPVALLYLLAVAPIGVVEELGHAGDHAGGLAAPSGEHFAAAHEAPLAERHVEGARRIEAPECLACVLSATSRFVVATAAASKDAPPSVEALEPRPAARVRAAMGGAQLGRAPPAA